MTEGLPESIALRLDDETRRSDAGRTLIGGSPLRLLRVSTTGAAIVDDLAGGRPVGPDPARQRVARRLLDSGLAHPVPNDHPDLGVSLVIPVRDQVDALGGLLDRLASTGAEVIVVDDGSLDPAAIDRVVAGRAVVLRHGTSRGPGAARNTGWRTTATDLVAFVDADVTPSPGWLGPLVDHFADPAVAAVAPRVRGRRRSDRVLDRYEQHRSPLDLGARSARVVPGGRVSYVPTATVVFRRSVLAALDGFDEDLRAGEDVDLVWRAVASGRTVRYEPAVTVAHDNRPTWRQFVRQRMAYGGSAAALDARHPGAVAPVAVNDWSLAAWATTAVGGRAGALAGAVTAAGSAAALLPALRDRVDDPVVETVRLAGRGHLWAGRWLASATVRAWLPPAVAAAVVSSRARRALLAAATVPNLAEWWEERPDLDPLRWTAARIVDDAAYCAGVWRGCARERSVRALLPARVGVPGLTDRRRRRAGRRSPRRSMRGPPSPRC